MEHGNECNENGKVIREAYKKIQSKFKLPDFDQLNDEFEISTIENDEFLVRNIRKKIAERFESCVSLINQVLNPDPGSLLEIYECKALTDEEKDEYYIIFRKIMSIQRLGLKADVSHDEKMETEYLRTAVAEWPEIKQHVARLVEKLKTAWDEEVHYKEYLAYMG